MEAYLLSQRSRKRLFFLRHLEWIRRIHYGHLQKKESVNQPIHLLSVRLQINPNFRNSVHEFLIHHPSYYLHVSFTGKGCFTNNIFSWTQYSPFILFELRCSLSKILSLQQYICDCETIFFFSSIFIFKILLLFKYSCLHFPSLHQSPSTPSHPHIPPLKQLFTSHILEVI